MLRFFFLLDDNAPPFSLDESIYREQLERDVSMNVLKNGKWGSYHGVPISKLVPANVAQILPHVNQVSEEVNIRYIGLNPTSSQNMTQVPVMIILSRFPQTDLPYRFTPHKSH